MSDTQPYQVTVEERDGYLFARIDASATNREVAPAYLGEILARARTANAKSVLIERRIPRGIATTLVYSQIGRIDEMARGMNLAIVDAEPDNYAHLERGIRFAEPKDVRIKAFQDVNEALKWLKSDVEH